MMQLSPFKALLVLAIPMILCSWLVMFCLNSLAVTRAVLPVFRHFEDPEVLAERRTQWEKIAPKDTLDHLVWFLQITDLHISQHDDPQKDPGRIIQLRRFCTETVQTIKPKVVLVSGDLTDAKTLGNFGSEQHEWEWKKYSEILRETRVTEMTTWLDTRGNHDTFNVPSRTSKLNYFRTHSPRGNFTSYHYRHTNGLDSISFIAVDACPDPGFRRPFNFFGILTEVEIQQLQIYAEEAKSSNVTIWFGHYPTSVISSAEPGIKDVMKGGVAYLSGHLHTLGGIAPELYALQKSGTLELELGDWKDNRLYRLLSVDHDLLTFTDVNFDEWPVVLITNPKNVRFYAPVHEPLDRISRSTHVRILAFSPNGIVHVSVQLPEESSWKQAAQVENSPLYVLPWDPSKYAIGTHTIRIIVKDRNGKTKEITQNFATRDAEVPAFGMLRRVVLLSDLGKVFAMLTLGMVFSSIIVLTCFRLGASTMIYCYVVRQIGRPGVPLSLIRELENVLKISWIYWTLMFVIGYTLLMPWFYGEIVNGVYGTVFVHGIRIEKQWLHGQMTYMYATTHMCFQVIPLCFTTILHARSKLKFPERRYRRIFYHLYYMYIIGSFIISLRLFSDSYGWISVITNGLLVWSGIVPAFFLWWKTWTLVASDHSVKRHSSHSKKQSMRS